MRLQTALLTLQLRSPFRLSYGVSETRESHWLRLSDEEGPEGWGEAAIPPYYGVSADAMRTVWDQAAALGRRLPDTLETIPAWVGADGPAPARCALDLALHDRLGKLAGLPLYRLLDLPQPRPLPTSFTIAIDTPEEMARLAVQAAGFRKLKLKLGGEGSDEARIAAVRAARPDASLRLDANAGWSYPQAERFLQDWQRYDLELVEQPLAKDQIENLGRLQRLTSIPLVADESVQSLADIEALARAGVRGVNLKLMKLGGVSAGVSCLRRARQLGLLVMLGCMVETAIGATAMAHLSGAAEWLDLDAPLLTSNDPFDGLRYDEAGQIHLPDRPGIGVTLKETEPA